MIDFLIVGQGLAGSILAMELKKKGASFHILADDVRPTSSQVAGGMFNPVTGKHLAKTWLAEDLFPFLHSYYSNLSNDLDTFFFHPKSIYRPFKNDNQKEQFIKAIDKHDLRKYCQLTEPSKSMSECIHEPLGGIMTSQGGWVDVPMLIARIKKHLSKCISNEVFSHHLLEINKEYISYKNYKAKRIIFCEGFYVKDNPLFCALPFNPVKGETLEIEIKDYAIDSIVNQNSWLMPLHNQIFRLGATYSWHELDFTPTRVGKEALQEKVSNYLKKSYSIKAHKAGVRPATKDRRPIVGSHRKYKNCLIFNGLGTKGVSMAPYFAHHFTDHLLTGKELHPQITIERFNTLY